jgi:hypothetical protein
VFILRKLPPAGLLRGQLGQPQQRVRTKSAQDNENEGIGFFALAQERGKECVSLWKQETCWFRRWKRDLACE